MFSQHTPLIHLKTWYSFEKRLWVFGIWRFVNMSRLHLRSMSTGYAAIQWNDGTQTADSEKYDLCRNFTVTFSFLKFSALYKWGKLKKKKNKQTKKVKPKEGSIIFFRRRSWIVRIWEVFACTRDWLHFFVLLIIPAVFTLLAPAWASFISSLHWLCHEPSSLSAKLFLLSLQKSTLLFISSCF